MRQRLDADEPTSRWAITNQEKVERILLHGGDVIRERFFQQAVTEMDDAGCRPNEWRCGLESSDELRALRAYRIIDLQPRARTMAEGSSDVGQDVRRACDDDLLDTGLNHLLEGMLSDGSVRHVLETEYMCACTAAGVAWRRGREYEDSVTSHAHLTATRPPYSRSGSGFLSSPVGRQPRTVPAVHYRAEVTRDASALPRRASPGCTSAGG
ncbi:MAG: hypothetical protein JO286_25620 [Solirubrobacterales bacterium]|nr:hypothetical protein [Solirubrobacterales bacterium]